MDVDESQIESLFFAALSKVSQADRAAFLDQACANDSALKERIEQLLDAQPQLGKFLTTVSLSDTVVDHEPQEISGRMIGAYQLQEVLGEGGMGIVYAAEQQRPIRRMVALKLVKPGMDSREVVARFEAERQALALMDHPNIAKVHDAGTTESGHPYFVMELVRGYTITEYCDEHRLPLRDRIKLLVTVCQAVQHAHQRGIIHRDLKPSNVMITSQDSVPVPKVIDFGVAKAVNQRLSEQTIYTRVAQVLGTPMYMSPEQAELGGTDVDARSDVYSLGILIYELLTGQLPFDRASYSKAGYDELRRMIREDEPLRPSRRVTTLATQTRSTISNLRGIDERQLSRQLRGDLDWIVMKALEKDRSRRYSSAEALAADLQSYLDDRPIKARPPSIAYRLRKFLRRKSRAVGVTTVVVLMAFLAICGPLAAYALFVILNRPEPQPDNRIENDAGKVVKEVNSPESTGQREVSEHVSSSPAAPVPEAKSNQAAADIFAIDESTDTLSPIAPGQTLPGLVSDPLVVPDVPRWQIITKRPRGILRSAVWSPDEMRLAVAEANHVRIYDSATMRLLHVLVGHTLPVRSVAWHPGGTRLASCSEDGTVRLWSSEGALIRLLLGHSVPVYQVSWQPDGKLLASAAADGTVRIWKANGALVRVIDDGDRHVFCLDWSPDGKLLATGGGDISPPDANGDPGNTTIRLWDVETWESVRQMGGTDGHTLLALKWRPDGTQLAAGYGDVYRSTQERFAPISRAGVKVWNLDGTPSVKSLAEQFGTMNTVAWDPGGRELAFGGRHGDVRTWDTVTHNITDTRKTHKIDINSIVWSRDGSRMLSTSRDTVCEWKENRDPRILLHGLSEQCYRYVKWNPDGSSIAAHIDNHILFWDDDGTPISKPAADAAKSPPWWNLQSLEHRPDGSRAQVLDVPKPVTNVREWAWSKTGRVAAATWAEANVRIWDEIGKLAATLKGHRGGVESVSWSPDGEWLATGGGDSIRLWKADGKAGPIMRGHSDEIYPVEWSPDGKWIASAGADSTMKLWTPDGNAGQVFRGHQGTIHDLAWSPDSQRIVSVSLLDSTLRVWNVETGKTEWQAVLLQPDYATTFTSSGQPRNNDREQLRSSLMYLAEKKDGAMEVMTFGDFRKRYAKPFITAYAALSKKAAARGDWISAEDNFTLALTFQLELEPSVRRIISEAGFEISEQLYANREYARAAAIVKSSLRVSPDSTSLRIQMGRIHLKLHQTTEAASEFTAAVRILSHQNANEWRPKYELAVLRLATEDIHGYRAMCETLLDDVTTKSSPEITRFVAWAIALHPRALDDYQLPLELIGHANNQRPNNVALMMTLGAVLHRAGRSQEAIDQLTKVNAMFGPQQTSPASWYSTLSNLSRDVKSSAGGPDLEEVPPAFVWYFLAMAHHAVGNRDAAAQWRQKADQWTDVILNDEHHSISWDREMTLQILRTQSQTLSETP